jgi:hypothetical protein
LQISRGQDRGESCVGLGRARNTRRRWTSIAGAVNRQFGCGRHSFQLGTVEVELIQPLEGRNAHKDFLDESGGGIHPILFEVQVIDPVLGELAKSGVTVLQSGTGIRPGTRWALLDARELIGFYLELRHRPGASDGTSLA